MELLTSGSLSLLPLQGCSCQHASVNVSVARVSANSQHVVRLRLRHKADAFTRVMLQRRYIF